MSEGDVSVGEVVPAEEEPVEEEQEGTGEANEPIEAPADGAEVELPAEESADDAPAGP